MMGYLLGDIPVPIRYSILEGLAEQRIERLCNSPNGRRIIAHGKGAHERDTAERILLFCCDSKTGIVFHVFS
jgi:hypothetical protein